jgi:hypothetical protein
MSRTAKVTALMWSKRQDGMEICRTYAAMLCHRGWVA